MQITFTPKIKGKMHTRIGLILMMCMIFFQNSFAQIQLVNEGFTTAIPLPTGWAAQNLSSPVGTTGWFQGNTATFAANSLPANSYIAANFQNTTGANTISNWLFMPNLTLRNGDILTFYTRTVNPSDFPDRLEVRLSTNGASVNAGATNTSVGDFTTLLLSVNPTLTTTGYPTAWTQFTVTLAGLAGPTSGRIAFRYFVTDAGPNGNNSDYMGIDDVVYTSFPGACSGTPTPGNTLSSVPTVCPLTNFTLSLENTTSGTGVTYQWQTSPDGTTWTDAAGTTATYTTQLAASTYYRARVTCSGSSAFSNPVQVLLTPPSGCYCLPPATNCNLDDRIANVTLNTLNNSSACTAGGYTNYTQTVAATNLVAGGRYPMAVTVGPGGTEYVGVWVDYNQNGVFDAAEFTLLGSGNGITINGTLPVSATALPGLTRMRVRVRFNTPLTGADACIGYTFGETEDYAVNIVPCVQGAVTTQPANASIGCSGSTSFSVATSGSLITYQWQTRTNATAPWTTVTNGGVFSGATTSTLTLTNAPQTLNGTQYRVAYSGACTSTDFSNPATLTVGPLIATVNPTSAAICAGAAPVLLQITNQGAPPVTTTICSNPLTLNIPDDTQNGVSTNLTVNIPAGAIITGMAVRLNMTHTYPGDMIINLRAPNGNILNLYKYNTGIFTGNFSVANAGWFNAAINNTATTAFSAVPTPYRYGITAPVGPFRPDAINTPVTGTVVNNPVGFASNVTTFGQLFSQPNGTWTLALADGGPGDLGILTSWCLDITYAAPASGTFSPATGLFTDAAGTIPYVAGTPVSSVYASPTTSTTYQLVVANTICTSPALNIPVTVSNTISGVTIPGTFSTCENGVTTLSASVANGNNLVYVWQVSNDGGVTWNNITDGGIYSGATTGTLSIAGVTIASNNDQYRVRVSNTCNAITSAASVLTVNPLPIVSITALPSTRLLPNQTTTLTATSTPAAATPNSYTWYYNGLPIANATTSSISVGIDQLGDYYAEVVDVNGCMSRSATIGISDSSSTILFIYPSPNSGQFQVRYQSAAGNSIIPRALNIYDAKGSRVYTKSYPINVPYTRMDVDMRKFGKGIYMVELADRNGVRIATGRVMIY